MIIPLPNTTTREISKKLVEAQEHYTLTTGRVLTLIVAAREDDDLENILSSVRDASHEHPSRVLVVVTGETGAGKTMVVTSLHLLAGARADPGRIRAGAELTRLDRGPQGALAMVTTTVEIEGVAKPACVSDSLFLLRPGKDAS